MIFDGSNKIGKVHLGNAIGKIFVGDDLVYQSYHGTRFRDYSVGDIVPVPYNGGYETCVVVHQGNPNSATYDASCDGTWLMFCYTTNYTSQNLPYYPKTSIKTTGMPAVYNNFGSFKSNVKTVKIPCVSYEDGSIVTYTGASGVEANVFPLSLNEAGYTVTESGYSNHDVGSKLDYFLSGNGTSQGTVREAYLQNGYTKWYTRGFYENNNGEHNVAMYTGTFYTGFPGTTAINQTTVGVRPAFIVEKKTPSIDTSTLVKINGTVADISQNVPSGKTISVSVDGHDLLSGSLPFYFNGGLIAVTIGGTQSDKVVYFRLNGLTVATLYASGSISIPAGKYNLAFSSEYVSALSILRLYYDLTEVTS